MEPASPPWLEGADHLLSRWQVMIDLLARTAGVPCVMINRLDTHCLHLQALNSGAPGFSCGERFDLSVNTYCARVLATRAPLLVEDARQLPEMHDNPNAQAGLLAYYGLPIRNPDGALFGTLCMLDTQPRKPDDGVRQLTGVLRDSIEQDLALLAANASARELRQSAEQANRAKTEFLARVSHELRTPLGAVLGFAQLLEMDTSAPLTTKQLERVAHIHQGGRHLLALLDDMLDVSRIEAGQLQLRPEPIEVGELLSQVLTLSQSQAEQLAVALQPPSGAGVVRADRNRLRQVLLNLVSNALKYNRPGGSVVALLQTSPDGARVRIEIRDDGLGMSAQQLAHLFEPFNRLGREHSPIPGTGLGLSLSRQLVELMGGTITVDREPGRGTCVAVELPCS